MPMKKYFLVWTFALLLPLLPCAQVTHQLHLGYGFDEFRAPFLENTPINLTADSPIWMKRNYFELSWDILVKGGFLLRERFSLGADKIPYRTNRHENHLAAEAWGLEGGDLLTFVQDFGYIHPLAQDRLRLSAGAGFGLHLRVNGATWVSPLQSRDLGDPVDEGYLVVYDAMGAVIQPFVGLSFSPVKHLWISLEQRHEFCFQSVNVGVRHDIYDGENFLGDWNEEILNDNSRSFQYQPPLVRVGWEFGPRKRKNKKLKEGVYFGPTTN
jgi:hypothetical protein